MSSPTFRPPAEDANPEFRIPTGWIACFAMIRLRALDGSSLQLGTNFIVPFEPRAGLELIWQKPDGETVLIAIVDRVRWEPLQGQFLVYLRERYADDVGNLSLPESAVQIIEDADELINHVRFSKLSFHPPGQFVQETIEHLDDADWHYSIRQRADGFWQFRVEDGRSEGLSPTREGAIEAAKAAITEMTTIGGSENENT